MPWESISGGSREPSTIGPVLRRLMRDLGGTGAEAIPVLVNRWAELVGPELAERSRPTSLRDGQLHVSAADSGTASALRWAAATVSQRAEELGLSVSIDQVVPRVERPGRGG
jgi:predicted nucleic acid-binding Zn ribbon protein